jgi:hypothetical protein
MSWCRRSASNLKAVAAGRTERRLLSLSGYVPIHDRVASVAADPRRCAHAFPKLAVRIRNSCPIRLPERAAVQEKPSHRVGTLVGDDNLFGGIPVRSNLHRGAIGPAYKAEDAAGVRRQVMPVAGALDLRRRPHPRITLWRGPGFEGTGADK